jgi:hypothetical protein
MSNSGKCVARPTGVRSAKAYGDEIPSARREAGSFPDAFRVPGRQATFVPADSFTNRKESLFETGCKTIP